MIIARLLSAMKLSDATSDDFSTFFDLRGEGEQPRGRKNIGKKKPQKVIQFGSALQTAPAYQRELGKGGGANVEGQETEAWKISFNFKQLPHFHKMLSAHC